MPREPEPACVACGYSLAGLPEDVVCPECALPVHRSLSFGGGNTPWQRRRSFGAWLRTALMLYRRPIRAWPEIGLHNARSGRSLAFVNITIASGFGVATPYVVNELRTPFGWTTWPWRNDAVEVLAGAVYLGLWCWIVCCLGARALVLLPPYVLKKSPRSRESRAAKWAIVGHATVFSLIATPLMAAVMLLPTIMPSRRRWWFQWEYALPQAVVYAPAVWLTATCLASFFGCVVLRRRLTRPRAHTNSTTPP